MAIASLFVYQHFMFSPATSPSGYSPPLNSPAIGREQPSDPERLSWARRTQLLHYRERTTFRKEECFKNLCLGISPITSSPLLTSANHLPPLLREGEVHNGRGGRQYYTFYNTRAYTCAWVCVRKDARLQDCKILLPQLGKYFFPVGKK